MMMIAITKETTYSTLPKPPGKRLVGAFFSTANPTAAPALERTSPKLFTPSVRMLRLFVQTPASTFMTPSTKLTALAEEETASFVLRSLASSDMTVPFSFAFARKGILSSVFVRFSLSCCKDGCPETPDRR